MASVYRAVIKISSSGVYAISRRGIEQLGSSFDSTCIFLLFPMKVAGGHTHICRGKSLAPGS